MDIKTAKIESLIPADYNPRRKSQHVLETIQDSLTEHGWLAPVIVNTHACGKCGDRQNIIIGGHRRIEAAKLKGEIDVPIVELDLHIEKEKKLNLQLNAQERFKENQLAQIIADLHADDPNSVKTIGFNSDEIINYLFQARYMNKDKIAGILLEKFLMPPFSVLDAKQGYWQERKKKWLDALGALTETRESTLAGTENNLLMRGLNAGVSIFDPVVSELMYSWFMPEGGVKVLDPFAGSLGRGGVAAAMGLDYTGIEVRKEQIEVNEAKLKELGIEARYIHANAKDLNKHIGTEEKFDLIFTCPPYYDLEVYSEQEDDLSAKQSYEEFMRDYEDIFRQATEHLNDNRFAILVLGDIRDERGMYRNFLGDNIAMMHRLGFHLYNEIIYVQMLATAPHRAERNMRKRKVVKTHQNIYTFYKGNPEVLRNPRLLETHYKVLTFLKGDPERVQEEYKNPPLIKRDAIETLRQ